jgi:integrase
MFPLAFVPVRAHIDGTDRWEEFMPRRAKGLSAAAVQKAKPGRYFDGDGLVLTVRGPDAKYWSLRYRKDGKLREMGLGPAAGRRGVTLAQARRLARDLFDQHKDGLDPLASKAGNHAAAGLNAITAPTFERAAIDYIEAHRSGWSDGETAQWEQSLRDHAFPILGKMPVASIDVPHIVAVLEPIWVEKSTTARRVRGRIERILGRAKVMKQRSGENPARWEENLKELMAKRAKAARVPQHHAMMHYDEIGDFMIELRTIDGVVARCLEFAVRCAARAGEVRFATWAEVDLAKREWTVPAARMKMGIEHKVPLDARSVEILQELARTRDGDFIFQIDGEPIGKDDMLQLLQRKMRRRDATVHGFRATYRTWIDERTSFKREVAEISLAHGNRDKVEAAYARAAFREQRRQLADAWGAFCDMPSVRPSGDVIAFGRGA